MRRSSYSRTKASTTAREGSGSIVNLWKLQAGEAVYVVPRQLRIFVGDDDGPPVPAEKKD